MATQELPFVLQKGEKLVNEAKGCKYAGIAYITHGSGVGATHSGLGIGFFRSKQTKREGSVFDSKSTYIYLTNRRLMFCNISTLQSIFGGIGTPFAEIPFRLIRALNPSSKFGWPAIDISIPSAQGGLDNIKLWFVGYPLRGKERDNFLALIKKLLR